MPVLLFSSQLVMVLLFRLSLIGKVSAAKDPEPPGFRIRSHDFHGPLPEIVVHDTGDSLAILDDISREAAKVNAIARHREELAAAYPGCRFLPHKILDSGVVVGMQVEGRTILAEAPTFWQAYGKLRRRGLRR